MLKPMKGTYILDKFARKWHLSNIDVPYLHLSVKLKFVKENIYIFGSHLLPIPFQFKIHFCNIPPKCRQWFLRHTKYHCFCLILRK